MVDDEPSSGVFQSLEILDYRGFLSYAIVQVLKMIPSDLRAEKPVRGEK